MKADELPTDPCLRVEQLRASYDWGEVVRGIDLHVARGELVAIVGPNGAGKSSLLKALFGMIRSSGRIEVAGVRIDRMRTDRRLASGLAFVPQGRCNFPQMTVRENLEVGALRLPRRQRATAIADAVDTFPALKPTMSRRAYVLSGGEQQVLEMAMALLVRPAVLMLDEPSLGLSPKNTQVVLDTVQSLRAGAVGALVVEQNVAEILAISDRAYVFDQGRVRLTASGSEMAADPRLRDIFLGGGFEARDEGR